MFRIVDLHSHILPGVDDGSQDMGMSLRMIRMAADSGTKIIAATPHCNTGSVIENYFDDALRTRYISLRNKAKEAGIPIQVVLGSEVFSTPDMPELYREGMLRTLNGSRYLLIEFDFYEEDPKFFEYIILELMAQGCVPIIAHPERYLIVQERPNTVYDWISLGALTQINRGSLQGRFAREVEKAAYQLLRQHLVTVIGSDAHADDMRTTNMRGLWELIERAASPEEARRVCETNAFKVLRNQPVDMSGAEIIKFL